MKLSADQKKVKVTLSEGTYQICNLKSYVSDTTVLEDDSLYRSTFTPDRNATKGNQISGSIEMEQDGYLITSIPYDSHLEIKVDGREVVTEKVNTTFSGLPAGKRGTLGDDHLPRPGNFCRKMDQSAGGLFVGR